MEEEMLKKKSKLPSESVSRDDKWVSIFFVITLLLCVFLVLRHVIRGRDPLEVQLTQTLQALEENSQQAIKLASRLQTEVSNRTQALQGLEFQLKELQQQRTLLDLTSEQRNALQGLLKRSRTPSEIFTSLDFWLEKVLVSITISSMFFGLGIRYQRRKAERLLVTTALDRNQTDDKLSPQIPDTR